MRVGYYEYCKSNSCLRGGESEFNASSTNAKTVLLGRTSYDLRINFLGVKSGE